MTSWITFPEPQAIQKKFLSQKKTTSAASFAFSVVRGAVRAASDVPVDLVADSSLANGRISIADWVQLHLIAAEHGIVLGLWTDHPAHVMYQVTVGAICSAVGDAGISRIRVGKIADQAIDELQRLRAQSPVEADKMLVDFQTAWDFDKWNMNRVNHLRYLKEAIQETGMQSILNAESMRGGLGSLPEPLREQFREAFANVELFGAIRYAQGIVQTQINSGEHQPEAIDFFTVVFSSVRDEAQAHTGRFVIAS